MLEANKYWEDRGLLFGDERINVLNKRLSDT